ncbi:MULTISPECIES: OmpA family protein [Thalassospira]|uniref:OmpA family protein n=1 Tax=Thalassospira TaxID=168934 RepID=UPI0008DE6637|nr:MULTISPECIES: OmpA family protein [Thalassospira]MAB34230.1 lysophospholipase [Thalassospira sp.]MDM7978249.1 OmpA family protein [Thalassospira xiamenensis]OHZ03398.1 lysophospholipase [Thalassospira sp. MIT1004]HBS24227.1 OmpA family protein [Thalassospira sp.]
MMGYSKISVLAFMAALGGNVVVSGGASAQQYTPVSVDSNVQVNWDVADGFGGQPTVPNYLSPSVPRDHISIAGSDLIYPETRPHSEFLAADRFAQNVGGATYGDGFETVVIDGSGSNDIPTQSQFYGVPGVTTSPSYDDGANQVIALNRPEPTAAPRAKPASPAAAQSGSSPVPLSKPTPAPKPAPAPVAEMAEAPKAEPAPKVETKPAEVEPPKAPPLPAEETKPAPPPPAPVPVVPNKSNVPEAPSPAPDTTTSPQEMLEQRSSNEPSTPPAPAPKPAAETAAVPPAAKDPVASAPSGAGEYSLAFGSGSFELNNAARAQLDSIVKNMGSDENMRIQLQAYAEGDSNNASKARRLSLSRALQVRSYLIDKGVRSTRIDVRALGANVPSGPADRVDIKTVQR